MLKFEWLWVLLALPLPVAVRQFLPKRESKSPSLKVPFFREVKDRRFAVTAPSSAVVSLAAIIWVALVCAAARPVWIEESAQIPTTGRDLLIALDISGSMQQQDFSMQGYSRFHAVQEIAGEFVSRRIGDRVGLILFGSQPYLYAPLTFDLDTVKEFLGHARVGFAGQQTAIGDTIGLAVKVLRERSAQNRILILLTDGDNSAGAIDPLEGMQLAVENGVRVFVIGIGFDHRSPAVANRRASYVLPKIAKATGGIYFHASDAKALEEIYRAIDQFEPIEAEARSQQLVAELYPWPLAAAMLLSIFLFSQHTFRESGFRRFRAGTENADAV